MAEALTVEAQGAPREEGMIAAEPEGVTRWYGKRLRRDREKRYLGMPFGSLSRWWKMQVPPEPYGPPPPPPLPYGGKQIHNGYGKGYHTHLHKHSGLKHQKHYKRKGRGFSKKKTHKRMVPPMAPDNSNEFLMQKTKLASPIPVAYNPLQHQTPKTPYTGASPLVYAMTPARAKDDGAEPDKHDKLGDMADEDHEKKQSIRIENYGSNHGLLRRTATKHTDDEDEEQGNIISSDEGSGSESDHGEEDLELVYHVDGSILGSTNDFEMSIREKIAEQEAAISRLTEENLTLKERMYILEKELGKIRRSVDVDSDRSEDVRDHVNRSVETATCPSETTSDHGIEKRDVEVAKED